MAASLLKEAIVDFFFAMYPAEASVFTASDAFVVCVCLCVYSFVASVVTGNCSKVDQLWSITPVVYVWMYYHQYHNEAGARPHHDRLLLLCCLITLWGGRLTYNFWKKGGYGNLISHEEDYRWPVLRDLIASPLAFFVFNLTFIATYQNLLLFLIAAPSAYEIMTQTSAVTLTFKDLAFAASFLFFLAMETIADQQHWNFQTKKYDFSGKERLNHKNRDIREGFYTGGLFRYCRHPNYFAEQMMWVSVACAPLAADGWTAHGREAAVLGHFIGVILLILLFQGSMAFGEYITLSKYPGYAAYQQSTSQCLPVPWSPILWELEAAERKKK